jgi:hypothetical protein
METRLSMFVELTTRDQNILAVIISDDEHIKRHVDWDPLVGS